MSPETVKITNMLVQLEARKAKSGTTLAIAGLGTTLVIEGLGLAAWRDIKRLQMGKLFLANVTESGRVPLRGQNILTYFFPELDAHSENKK